MQDAYIGFGSNLGNSEEILVAARLLLASHPGVEHIQSSHLYRTNPISTIPQPDFLNAVVKCQFKGDYRTLFLHLCEIEKQFKRERKNVEEPRFLDLDLLLFGDLFVDESDLTIPHPRMLTRAFVVVPLLELIPSGTIAFPTREGIHMVQLHETMQKIEKDPEQRVEKMTSIRWDKETV